MIYYKSNVFFVLIKDLNLMDKSVFLVNYQNIGIKLLRTVFNVQMVEIIFVVFVTARTAQPTAHCMQAAWVPYLDNGCILKV